MKFRIESRAVRSGINNAARRLMVLPVLAAGALLALAPRANAQTSTFSMVGLTTANKLVAIQVRTKNGRVRVSTSSARVIRGLAANETLLGIDFRPATGQLFAVGSSGQLYVLDATRRVTATPIGAPIAVGLNGNTFGVDFNPVPDRLRLVSDNEQNLRINPDTGVATQDTALAFAATDTNARVDPIIVASGYTNSVAGATTTTLYNIDAGRDVLVIQTPPNNGTLNTVGALGVDASSVVGFDIAPVSGTAVAAIQTSGARRSQLFFLNLSTGAATLIGNISGQPIRGLAILPGQ